MTNRRRILLVVLALLPAVAAAVLWARSYRRRDRLLWEADRGEGRRVVCHLYSSRARVCFASYSRPVDPGVAPPVPTSFQSGDRASTGAMSEEVNNQLQQAGVVGAGPFGFAYSRHAAAMVSGTHVWTGAVVPWWAVTVVMALPAYLAYLRVRPKKPPTAEPPEEVAPAPAPAGAAPAPTTPHRWGRPPPRRPKSYR